MDAVLEILLTLCSDEKLRKVPITNGRRMKIRKIVHILSRKHPPLYYELFKVLGCEDEVCIYKSLGLKFRRAYGIDINLGNIETLGDICARLEELRRIDDRPNACGRRSRLQRSRLRDTG